MDIAKLLNGIKIDRTGHAPMYVQVANCLAAKIHDSSIASRTKLPPERELARLLDVSRTTVINAYGLLEERGLVATRVGSGTYVTTSPETGRQPERIPWEQLFIPQYNSPLASLIRSLIANPTGDDTISFAAGMPAPEFYPLAILEKIAPRSAYPADFGYIPTEGFLPLKHSLARWLGSLGFKSSPDNILIVSGSQQGLYLTVKTLVERQDYVIVESPTYLGALQILESSGARILCLPQSERLDLKLLEDYLIRYRPKMLYTIPTFHNPTGKVMSLEDRKELLRLASRYRLAIVEDDPYGQLYYGQQPPPPLQSLDTYGGVIYLGTFSKILIPGLRIGWVSAAQPVIDRLAQEKQYVDLHSNNLSQQILHRCLEEDFLPGHLKIIRREYKKRRDAMASALRRYCSSYLDFELAEGGFYFWCNVRPPASPAELLRRAAAAGISFVPGEAFYPHGTASRRIRLCFATHSEERIGEGIRLLGRILASGAANTALPPHSAGRPII